MQMPSEKGGQGIGHRHADHHNEPEDIEGEDPSDGRNEIRDDGLVPISKL